MIGKPGPIFRMAALTVVVVIGGALVAYVAVNAILWIIFTVFHS